MSCVRKLRINVNLTASHWPVQTFAHLWSFAALRLQSIRDFGMFLAQIFNLDLVVCSDWITFTK